MKKKKNAMLTFKIKKKSGKYKERQKIIYVRVIL